MTEETSSSARGGATPADLAAEQVESIVAAAQEASDGIRKQAQRDAQEREKHLNQEAETIRAEARRDATRELESARRKAARLGEDARQEAQTLLEESRAEANELREHTRNEVAGRVEGAEQAAEEVLAEARALSGGLRRLGKSLGEQAERILRDVDAAHKRMRADLRAPVPEKSDFELSPRPARGRVQGLDDDRAFELPEVGDVPSARRSSSATRRGTTRPPRRTPEPRAGRAAEADAPASESDGPFDAAEVEELAEMGEPARSRPAGGTKPREVASRESEPFDAGDLDHDSGDDLDVPSWLGGERPT